MVVLQVDGSFEGLSAYVVVINLYGISFWSAGTCQGAIYSIVKP